MVEFIRRTKIYGVLAHKCPRCHEGSLFVDSNPYHLKDMLKMHKNCAKCGLSFEKENWFYYGAMYSSYALNVLWGVILFGFYYLFLWDTPLYVYLLMFVLSLVIFMPVFIRLSRSLWISLFEKYDPDALKNPINKGSKGA